MNYSHNRRHLSAAEFIEQGTSAGAVLSIANSNPELRHSLRQVAAEIHDITGQPLRIPGLVTLEREEARLAKYGRRREAA